MFTEINIELTSRCNKHCEICNRWRDGKEKGDMPFYMLDDIAGQLPDGVIVHFHNNGEPLLYPHLAYAMKAFRRQVRQFDTNGFLLLERAEDIKNVDIISLSVIQNDSTGDRQLEIAESYLKIKPETQIFVARLVGDIDEGRLARIKAWGVPIVRRIVHDKTGRTAYTKETVRPEDMICRDLLNHPAIDRFGNFSVCVKYDPDGKGIIGNITKESIASIWYGDKRKEYLKKHIACDRKSLAFCQNCEYYGYPNA